VKVERETGTLYGTKHSMHNRIRNILLEASESFNLKNKRLIVVDVQEEYKLGFSFPIKDFTSFINKNIKHMQECIFLYNGESLGFSQRTGIYLLVI
jgi:hypothetical protein